MVQLINVSGVTSLPTWWQSQQQQHENTGEEVQIKEIQWFYSASIGEEDKKPQLR